MRLHGSARKHFDRDRLTLAGVLYAAQHPAYRASLDDEDDPRRWLLLGFDDTGRLLELVVLIFDSGGGAADPRDEGSAAVHRTAALTPAPMHPQGRAAVDTAVSKRAHKRPLLSR